MTELAERARVSLSRYAGINVEYNAVGLQTLDEWIERHLSQFPEPSYEIRSVWAAFLGETFRRRYQGQWGTAAASQRPRLGIICFREDGSFVFVDILNLINRRLEAGMNESLAFYYTIKGVEIKA
jgi:hypothetical protein